MLSLFLLCRAHYELFIRALDAPNVRSGSVCLVHPTVGPTQDDDIPGDIRYKTYEVRLYVCVCVCACMHVCACVYLSVRERACVCLHVSVHVCVCLPCSVSVFPAS
jgi:hypothetical protein